MGPGVTRPALALAVLLSLLAPASQVLAYEDQLTLGLSAGYAHAPGATDSHGVVVDAAVGVGLDPVWTLRLRGGYGLHPGDQATHLGLATGELLYVIDVLEVVPYFGLGAGGLLAVAEGESTADAIAGPVVGADYLLSRELALSLDLRLKVRLTALDDEPLYLVAAGGVVIFFDLY